MVANCSIVASPEEGSDSNAHGGIAGRQLILN